ncbi:MAG: hypothetical protein ACRCVD_09415, partial [Halioglobus sp.]
QEHDHSILAVPVSAVLDSGVRTLVYVEREQGRFVPVEVTLGPRAGDMYPVLSGLHGGERVAVRGNFLLDSQAQIQGLNSLFHTPAPAAVPGHQHDAAPPPAPAAHQH